MKSVWKSAQPNQETGKCLEIDVNYPIMKGRVIFQEVPLDNLKW